MAVPDKVNPEKAIQAVFGGREIGYRRGHNRSLPEFGKHQGISKAVQDNRSMRKKVV